MKIYIASDHRGVSEKEEIINYLQDNKMDIEDIGLANTEFDDYPDFAFKLGNLVSKNPQNLGILICGNGIGMSIAANKVKGIRAIRAIDEDDAYNGKIHNSANVLCLGSNLEKDLVKKIVNTFINTSNPFEERHIKRVNKIIKYENGEYNEL